MQHGNLSQMERAFEILGMSRANVAEFHSENMADFNEVATDLASVGYYSFGSKKKEMQITENKRKITKKKKENGKRINGIVIGVGDCSGRSGIKFARLQLEKTLQRILDILNT